MFKSEFENKQKEIFDDCLTPKEFREAIAKLAWNEGHSHGYEEVLIYVEEFATSFKEPFKQYNERMLMFHQNIPCPSNRKNK